MTQDQVFSTGEGDRWFLRNRSALADADRLVDDPVIRLLEITALMPERVLEIGASNGYRLHALHARMNCEVTAVEPSQEAIDDGRRKYPAVTFFSGLASDIPIDENARFDLVIVNFVLHWVDRSTLLRSVAEIDRMVADGGYLLIGDFYPVRPERVAYHHLPGTDVATYKQSYADIFIASVLYEEVAALTFDHTNHQIRPDADGDNRIRVSLLRKSLHGKYATGNHAR